MDKIQESINNQRVHLREILAQYQRPNRWRSTWELANTLVPYFVLWYLMVLSLRVSYLLTLGLAVLTAGFMVRTFIIFHDCGHGSFFKSRRANDVVGIITGIITFTPTIVGDMIMPSTMLRPATWTGAALVMCRL